MSIAVNELPSRSTAVTAIDGGRDRRPAADRVADDGGDRAAPNSRHALLGAIADAVEALLPAGTGTAAAAAQPDDGHASKQALHGFVHALLAELRPSAGVGGHGRGFAWGRTTAATLGQRLDDLIARLKAGSATTSPPPTTAATPTAATAATAAPDTAAANASTPAAASGATPGTTPPAASTPASAPASSLLTAFGKLATARGAGEGGSATADALIAMLKRVASALGADAGAPAPAVGGLLDATA
jgi:hypothetical protein